MADFRIGDYDYTIIDSENRYVEAKVWDKTKVTYGALSGTVEYDGVTYTLTSMATCFFDCPSFNQSIEIPNSVTSMTRCFSYCLSFNQPIEIPKSVIYMSYCFYYCTSFDQLIKIPDSVTHMSHCFEGCRSFNQSILCFNNPTFYNNIFTSTEKDITIIAIGEDNYSTWKTIVNNSPNNVEIPDDYFSFEYGDYIYDGSDDRIRVVAIDKTKVEYEEFLKTYINNRKVTSMSSCFWNCTSFNQSITIPDSIIYMNGCFYGCTSFDQLIKIPDSVTDMGYCFYGCISFNQSIKIPDSVTDMGACFYGCTSFDQLIKIPDSVTKMYWCFRSCTYFNQPIEIPDLVTDMNGCFQDCVSFNQPVEIPDSVMDMKECFRNCVSLEANIKVKNIIQKRMELYNVFSNTKKDIYIINEAVPSSKESVAEVWREVANEHPNVHYEFDDHPSPLLELEARRVDERSKPSTLGMCALVNLKYTFSNLYIPYNYPAPSLESESLVLDDIRTIPLTEKRSYLINHIDENQHVFVYTVSDGYKTSTITKILSRVMALLDFQGDSGKDYVDIPGMGMAIGTIATRNGLVIQFPTAIGDEILPATKEVYIPTTDTEFNLEKEYYEKDGDNYILTEDTEFIDGKEYYEKKEAVDLNNYQLIIGKYNKKDKDSAFIIGNGDKNERSNVLTVNWQGKEWLADTLEVSRDPSENLEVATKQYADGKVSKTGDAMTGDLYRKQTNVDASKADNNVSGMAYPAYLISDVSGRVLTRLESVINPNGSIGSYWYVRNYDTTGEGVGLKGISMHMDKTGALTYNVSDNAKFHSALGESDWVVDGGWKDFGSYRWMWKRWNSGVQELDLIWQFTNSPYTTWNNMHGRSVNIGWGNDIGKNFIDNWYEITQHWEVGSGFGIAGSVLSKATNGCTCYGLSSSSGSQTCRLSVHVVGRWK